MFEAYKIRKRLLMTALLICCATINLFAQNNPYHINDKLYDLFVNAFNHQTTKEGGILSDSLLQRSITLGDRNGEIYALQIKLTNECLKNDNLPAVDKAMNALMERSLKYGMITFYYRAVSLKIYYLARQEQYIEALLFLEEQMKVAKKQNDMKAICALHRMIAVIMQSRGELSQAIGLFQDIIEEYKKNGWNKYIAREYLSISDCYRIMADYEKMEEVAMNALPYCKSQNDKNDNFLYQAYACFMLKRYDEFIDRYQYIQDHKLKINNTYLIMNDALEVFKAIYDGRDADAKAGIDKIAKVSEKESYRLYVAFYSYKNDLLKSIEYMRKLIRARHKSSEETFQLDRKAMNAIYSDQQMKAEKQSIMNKNAELKLSNTNMMLKNSELELGRIRDAISLANAEETRNDLFDTHQKLVARQLNDSITAKKLIQQAKDRQHKIERYIFEATIIIILIAIILTIIYAGRKKVLARKMSRTNKKLKESITLLDTAKKKAQESEKMKTMFVQNMSHEIRTPLNAIVGFSHVLTDMGNDFNTEEKENMAKYITDNSELLTTLINDILDLTQIKSGSLTISKAPTKINELCRECIETVRYRLNKGVQMIFNTDADDAFSINSDRNRICQVLINMLTNAEKNTFEGSITIDCSLKKNPGMVTLTVTDTGIGISPEKQKHIFDRYEKLDRIKPGAGLGLDICRTIANGMGGTIDINPHYEQGAQFWFTIPTE